jgi:branched-chain amino acid transport system permease protein
MVSALTGARRDGQGGQSLGLALRGGGACVLLAALVVFPVAFTNQVATTIGVDTLIFVAAAVAWNLFSGYSGYISLGHAVFFGSGAYVAGIAARDWHITGPAEFALLPLSCVAAAIIAVPFGLIALRVRRHTFVVITIAVFFIFQLMALNFAVTDGTNGLNAPFLLWPAATFYDRFYYMALGIAAFTVGLSALIKGSRFGLQLRAIRDDEERARGLGVRTMRVKLAAFIISGAVTGLLGGLWFFFIGQVLPQSGFDPLFDLAVALMAFFGGLGTVFGPVLGALILEPGQQYLTLRITNDYLSQMLLGAVFLAVILLLPRGVIPTVSEKMAQWRARRSGRAGGTPVPPGALAPGATAGAAASSGAAGGSGAGGAAADVRGKGAAP